MSIAVTTRSFSNAREGANLSETKLTSTYVQANGITHLGDLVMDDPRGTEGQPLFVPALTMRDGLAHDVVFACDMSGNAYAWDFNTYKLLWKQRIGNPITVTKQLDMWQINPFWSVCSTPVINLATSTLYAVSLSSHTGAIANGTYRLHSLSLVDGSDQAPPLTLDNATYTANGKSFRLGAVARKQRPALLFDSRSGRDTVFIAFGSFAESAATNNGFVLACDVTALKPSVAAIWTTGVNYPGPGIWMAGQGLSMDADGYIYGMTGNGGFDPPLNVGECFFKLQYTPAVGAFSASLACVDWWSPYSDAGRDGQDPTQPVITGSMVDMDDAGPTNAMNNMVMGKPTNVRSVVQDQDLGSGGLLLLPASGTGYSKNAGIGAGKDGISYVVNTDNMGQTQRADFAADKIGENYAKLLSPPWGMTFNGIGMNMAPTDLTMLPVLPNGKTAHVHGSMATYKSPDHGRLVCVGGENGPVRAIAINPDFTLTYVGCSQEVASPASPPPGGMPGTMLSISADGDGTNTAVLWCTMPTGNANSSITPGRLLAYAPNWIDSNGHLIKLWDSFSWNVSFFFNKFNPPVCIAGKLLVPTYDGRIMVWG